MNKELSLIVGRRGVARPFKRGLPFTRAGHTLLAAMCEGSLTERLLQPVLDNPLSRGDAVQDTSA